MPGSTSIFPLTPPYSAADSYPQQTRSGSSPLSSQHVPIHRERHPEFYFKDGTVTFSIPERNQEMLYRLYPGLLALQSSVLDFLLSLPQQEGQQNAEGRCDKNPIVLRGIIRHDFDYLLTFLSGGYVGEELREEFLISVLKLSAFFDITNGLQYAVTELAQLLQIKTSLKLQLSRLYHVDQWVEPAFQELMTRPLSSISCLEAHCLGIDCFYTLTHTKALIEENCHAIAYMEPPLVQYGCDTPLQCATTWKDEWWNGIAQQLLHPESPCRGEDLLMLLDHTEIPGICAFCKEATVLQLKDSDALRNDAILQDIAVVEVMEFQTDEHIRAPFRNAIHM